MCGGARAHTSGVCVLSTCKQTDLLPVQFPWWKVCCLMACRGSSKGGGIKLGAVRFEYATDDNAGTGNIFVRFGERF